jgi:hypothetical protein
MIGRPGNAARPAALARAVAVSAFVFMAYVAARNSVAIASIPSPIPSDTTPAPVPTTIGAIPDGDVDGTQSAGGVVPKITTLPKKRIHRFRQNVKTGGGGITIVQTAHCGKAVHCRKPVRGRAHDR